MKNAVIKLLKDKGKEDLFTEDRYLVVLKLSTYSPDHKIWAKLLFDEHFRIRSQWIADNIIHLVETNQLK